MATLRGLQQISDDVSTFTAIAQSTISGGQFVKGASNEDVVEAGSVAAFIAEDIVVEKAATSTDDELIVGMALETATSGNSITVGTEGLFIVAAQDAVAVGKAINASNDSDAFCNSVTVVGDGEEEFKIGKALTGASASGKYLVGLIRI